MVAKIQSSRKVAKKSAFRLLLYRNNITYFVFCLLFRKIIAPWQKSIIHYCNKKYYLSWSAIIENESSKCSTRDYSKLRGFMNSKSKKAAIVRASRKQKSTWCLSRRHNCAGWKFTWAACGNKTENSTKKKIAQSTLSMPRAPTPAIGVAKFQFADKDPLTCAPKRHTRALPLHRELF